MKLNLILSTALLIGISMTACYKNRILDATRDNMRPVLERRGAYAKSCPDNHVDFSRFLHGGTVDGMPISIVEAGTLEVPTGFLVAADPFYLTADFTCPFDQPVPPGRYPVILSVADLGPWGNRVAFATIQFSRKAATAWEVAETNDPSGLTQFFGVDAGLACFADSKTANLFADILREFEEKNPNGNYYDDVLSVDLPATANWCNHYPDGTPDLNAIIFSSGLGDGLYSHYWGLDAEGAVCRLLIDFQLFDSKGMIVAE